MSLVDVANQNKFNLEDHLLNFIQDHMDESKVSSFVEAMNKEEEFAEFVNQWMEGQE